MAGPDQILPPKAQPPPWRFDVDLVDRARQRNRTRTSVRASIALTAR